MIKRFENFNTDIHIIEDIFQEFTDEYDVDIKIEDINNSKIQPKNYKIEIKSKKGFYDKNGEAVSLLKDLKDKCLNMINMKLILFNINFICFKILEYPIRAQVYYQNIDISKAEKISEISKQFKIKRISICLQYD